jgi:hypothetical protein
VNLIGLEAVGLTLAVAAGFCAVTIPVAKRAVDNRILLNFI